MRVSDRKFRAAHLDKESDHFQTLNNVYCHGFRVDEFLHAEPTVLAAVARVLDPAERHFPAIEKYELSRVDEASTSKAETARGRVEL